MKKYSILLLLGLSTLYWGNSFADVNVKGYYRADGTYVHPYTRSEPHRKGEANLTTQETKKTVKTSKDTTKNKKKHKRKHKSKTVKDTLKTDTSSKDATTKDNPSKKTRKNTRKTRSSRSQLIADRAWQSKANFINKKGRTKARSNAVNRPNSNSARP